MAGWLLVCIWVSAVGVVYPGIRIITTAVIPSQNYIYEKYPHTIVHEPKTHKGDRALKGHDLERLPRGRRLCMCEWYINVDGRSIVHVYNLKTDTPTPFFYVI